jgi:hypothetical protein
MAGVSKSQFALVEILNDRQATPAQKARAMATLRALVDPPAKASAPPVNSPRVRALEAQVASLTELAVMTAANNAREASKARVLASVTPEQRLTAHQRDLLDRSDPRRRPPVAQTARATAQGCILTMPAACSREQARARLAELEGR